MFVEGKSYRDIVEKIVEAGKMEYIICQGEVVDGVVGAKLATHVHSSSNKGKLVLQYTGRFSTGLTTDMRNAELSYLYNKVQEKQHSRAKLNHQTSCLEGQELWFVRNELSKLTSQFFMDGRVGTRSDVRIRNRHCSPISSSRF